MEQELTTKTTPEMDDNIEKTAKNEMPTLKWIWYVIGIVCFIFALTYLVKANDFLAGNAKMFTNNFKGMDLKYVGGDAYNYIIAGTYSTTLTVRALFFAFLGGICLLMGK
jgi:hypothetical protein